MSVINDEVNSQRASNHTPEAVPASQVMVSIDDLTELDLEQVAGGVSGSGDAQSACNASMACSVSL